MTDLKFLNQVFVFYFSILHSYSNLLKVETWYFIHIFSTTDSTVYDLHFIILRSFFLKKNSIGQKTPFCLLIDFHSTTYWKAIRLWVCFNLYIIGCIVRRVLFCISHYWLEIVVPKWVGGVLHSRDGVRIPWQGYCFVPSGLEEGLVVFKVVISGNP